MLGLQALNVVLAVVGWRRRTVSRSGAVAGWAVGAGVGLALGWPGYGLLVLYFAVTAAATRFRRTAKADRGIAEAGRGARGARQVAANGGPPLLFALAGGEFAALGFLGALVTAAADTVSSEIGKGIGGPARRLADLSPVPPGTAGAVSRAGTAAGLVAAVGLAAVAGALGLLPARLAVLAGGAGFLAAVLEGLLAPLEQAGVLGNDGVNAVSVFAGGLLAVCLGWLLAGSA